jgi:hypothetical protein
MYHHASLNVSSFLFSMQHDRVVRKSCLFRENQSPSNERLLSLPSTQTRISSRFSPPLIRRSNSRPHQQSHCCTNEQENHRLVFRTISLETDRGHVLLFCRRTYGQVVRQTELLGAIGASARVMRRRFLVLGVGSVEQEGRFIGGCLAIGCCGRGERYYGAVGEAGALAEGRWRWVGVSEVSSVEGFMYIQAARDSERKERKRKTCFQFIRAIVDV